MKLIILLHMTLNESNSAYIALFPSLWYDGNNEFMNVCTHVAIFYPEESGHEGASSNSLLTPSNGLCLSK